MYICVTHVDARTGIPCNVAPMSHGPAFPAIKGLRVEWANQSQWPTDFPLFYGTCDDDADTTVPGVVRALTQAEHDAAWAQEFGPAAVQERIVQQTQQRLDAFARTRNYDGILSLCTYATSTVPKFQAEGQYGVTARDATWAKLYEMLAEVEAGTRPVPTGYADIEPELPVLQWPTA
jgi:hypothetical protein